jgi:diguanylate cyclase (GGDEF)-like protein
MGEKFLEFLSKKKTLLFLIMCFMVHLFNVFLFYYLRLIPFCILNVFSVAFYISIIFSYNPESDNCIIFSYFEIVTFSFISAAFCGGAFCYIFYVIGMISVVFYLLPPRKRMKHLFQGLGILYAIGIYYIRIKKICLFPEYADKIEKYASQIGFMNLCVTLFTLFYISNLYIFELNSASEKLNYFSNHDLLTGLFNRRFFEFIMKRNKKENENQYTIAIFDIDDFKKVNDTFGHQAGDRVLKVVSKLIEETTSDEYIAVRWGGEEFILYMPDTNEDKAYEILTNLCNKIHDTTVEFENLRLSVSVTIGMCTGYNLIAYESIIRQADDKLYYGKRNGKNQVVR